MAIYLQLDGVKGDATQQNHVGWTDIGTMDWHVGRVLNTLAGATANNRHDGGIEVGEIKLSKTSDGSSVRLEQMALSGSRSGTAKIHLAASGNPGNNVLEYTLSNVLVSGYHLTVENDRPIERISLNFTKMEMAYIPFDSRNQPQAPLRASVDLAKLSGSHTSPHTRHARRERRKAARDKVHAAARKTGTKVYAWQTIPEVDLGSADGFRIVGYPGAEPLLRAPAERDNQLVATLYQILARNPKVAQNLRNHCKGEGLEMPAAGSEAEAIHAADLTMMGLIGLRGGSGLSCVERPIVGSANDLSPQGFETIFKREWQTGVSERLHHPSDASGVTLGAGYDMKGKFDSQIKADLIAVGVDAKTAEAVSDATGRYGARADDFCRDNHDLIVMPEPQQRALLQVELPRHLKKIAIALSPSVRQRLFVHEFDALASFFYTLDPSAAPALMNALNGGDLEAGANLFSLYVHSGKKISLELTKRRGLEKAMFVEGRYV